MTTPLVRALPNVLDDVEIVEHKGRGHPDTICDAVAEAASRALSARDLAQHGTIHHHNVDKALLVGGRADARFGGGEVSLPMVLHLAGRASGDDVAEVAIGAARAWLRENLHALDVDRHVRFESWIRPGSTELVDLFARGRRANDTSFGAGYAPLSATERVVLACGRKLGELSRASETSYVGEDVKVLAIRRGRRLDLTVACAMVASHVSSLADYLELRAAVASAVGSAARATANDELEIDVTVNAADDVARGSVYLTVTGTSAEAGDDGEVGRGNRVNGLITPMRPMTIEAAAGKNAVTHVGKLYNVAAHALAAEVVADVPGVYRAECYLASRIGAPIDEPALVDLRVAPLPASQRARIEEIARAHVAAIPSLWRRIVDGDVRLF